MVPFDQKGDLAITTNNSKIHCSSNTKADVLDKITLRAVQLSSLVAKEAGFLFCLWQLLGDRSTCSS